MRRRFCGLLCAVLVGVFALTANAVAACATDEIDVLGDGTQCEESKFEITTTNDTNEFIFKLSAKGTFYVDWGDGVVDVITRSDGNTMEYSHSYSGSQSYVIRFGGVATGYTGGGYMVPTIIFYKSSGGTQDKIAGLSGALGKLFPNRVDYKQTFKDAINLTSIPSTLFNGHNTNSAGDHGFEECFAGCTGLTSIPNNLFHDFSRIKNDTFRGTFYGCSSLTAIPADLFSGMWASGGTYGMFSETFKDCTSLTSVPSGLFDDINASSASWTDIRNMFSSTFDGCTSLTTIPSGLFGGHPSGNTWTNAASMFESTFRNTKLTSIPGDLFDGLDTSNATATNTMFRYTFENTPISSIPNGLFDIVDTGNATNMSGMFNSTFNGTDITSIPSGLFNTIDTSSATNTTGMFSTTFKDTSITSIPSGLFNAIDTSSAANTSDMFNSTFMNTPITNIPNGLFDSIDTSNATNTSQMFKNTFNGTQITAIPSGLFDAVDTSNSTNTGGMFSSTFMNTPITNIPNGLFDSIDTSRSEDTNYMFSSTFRGTEITSIPNNLFSTISIRNVTDGKYMFNQTFYDCSNLSGFIPSNTFATLVADGAPTTPNMWSSTFNGTQLLSICPNGYEQYITGYESSWNGKVSCAICANTLPEHATWTVNTCNWTCDNGYTANNNICAVTVCTGATYYDITYPSGCRPCPVGYNYDTAPGKTSVSQCQISCNAGTWNGGYTQLEYIETTGTQYIDTGLLVASLTNPIMSTTMQFTALESGKQSGASQSSPELHFKFGLSGTTAFMLQAGGGGSETKFNGADTNKHTFVMNTANGTCSLDDDTRQLSVGNLSALNAAILIGTVSSGTGVNTSKFGSARYYNVYIISDGVLVMNLVPVRRNSDGIVGMYDLVTGVFFPNAGTGDFGAGANVGALSGVCVNVGTGYWSVASTMNYGSVGVRNACPIGTYSDITNGTSVAACKPCAGATYNDTIAAAACTACPNGYDYNTESGKTSIGQCQVHCDSGTYVKTSVEAYTQLEYIETTGTQYVDTRVVPANLVNPVVTTTLQYTSTARSQQNGIRNVNSMYLMFGTSGTNDRFVIQAAGGGTETLFGVPDTNKHTFVIDTSNRTCAIDNDVRTLNVGDLFKLTKSIYIGNANGQSRANYAKYYNVNIVSDGVEVMNLIPVRRDSDNAIGMYDTVTSAFFPNAGTDTFIAGPDVGAIDGVCVNVGAGYWATASTVNYGNSSTRNACPDGLTTVGYGHGADSLDDCGRVLHIGNYNLYTKSTKPTDPALNLMYSDGNTYHIGLSTTDNMLSKLHMWHDGITYTAFDDSLLHGERNFETDEQISQ